MAETAAAVAAKTAAAKTEAKEGAEKSLISRDELSALQQLMGATNSVIQKCIVLANAALGTLGKDVGAIEHLKEELSEDHTETFREIDEGANESVGKALKAGFEISKAAGMVESLIDLNRSVTDTWVRSFKEILVELCKLNIDGIKIGNSSMHSLVEVAHELPDTLQTFRNKLMGTLMQAGESLQKGGSPVQLVTAIIHSLPLSPEKKLEEAVREAQVTRDLANDALDAMAMAAGMEMSKEDRTQVDKILTLATESTAKIVPAIVKLAQASTTKSKDARNQLLEDFLTLANDSAAKGNEGKGLLGSLIQTIKDNHALKATLEVAQAKASVSLGSGGAPIALVRQILGREPAVSFSLLWQGVQAQMVMEAAATQAATMTSASSGASGPGKPIDTAFASASGAGPNLHHLAEGSTSAPTSPSPGSSAAVPSPSKSPNKPS